MNPARDESLSDRIDRALNDRQSNNQLRRRRVVRSIDSTTIEVDGHQLINFAGNDYLGLAHHPDLRALVSETNGAAASALVTGYSPAHASAEARIARWKSTELAVLLPSGYQANHAAVQTFAALGNVRFLVDKLAHASLIDAVRGSGQPFRVFPHNHLDKLRRLLADAPVDQLQVVVTESIFSMDGDAADLAGISTLKSEFGFALLLDEAHGSGVYGPGGSGYAAEVGLSNLVDVAVCTFSKAAGLAGGAICGSSAFCSAVENFGRAYIYSTAMPPVLAMQIERSISLMEEEPQRQSRVQMLATRVRSRLRDAGLEIPDGDSPIVPVILRSETATLAAAERLADLGIYVVAIRPPTVAPNASRLRVTVSCEHTDEQVEMLVNSLS